jgi:hypothetical protein
MLRGDHLKTKEEIKYEAREKQLNYEFQKKLIQNEIQTKNIRNMAKKTFVEDTKSHLPLSILPRCHQCREPLLPNMPYHQIGQLKFHTNHLICSLCPEGSGS